jgi:hypothetical protein
VVSTTTWLPVTVAGSDLPQRWQGLDTQVQVSVLEQFFICLGYICLHLSPGNAWFGLLGSAVGADYICGE